MDEGVPAPTAKRSFSRFAVHRGFQSRALYSPARRKPDQMYAAGQRADCSPRPHHARDRWDMDCSRKRRCRQAGSGPNWPCLRSAGRSKVYTSPRMARSGNREPVLLGLGERGALATLPRRLSSPDFPAKRLGKLPSGQSLIRRCGVAGSRGWTGSCLYPGLPFRAAAKDS